MKRLLLLLILLCGCLGRPVPPKLGLPKSEASQPVVHIVSSNEESLQDIAKWYTGKASNWAILSQYNSRKGKTKLLKGESILIPQGLLKHRKPFVSEVKKSNSVPKKAAKSEKVKNQEVDRFDEDYGDESEVVDGPVTPKKEDQVQDIPAVVPVTPTSTPESSIVPTPVPSNGGDVPIESDAEKRRLQLLKELLEK